MKLNPRNFKEAAKETIINLRQVNNYEEILLNFDSKKYYIFLVVKLGKECLDKLIFNSSAFTIINETLDDYLSEKAKYKNFPILVIDIYALHISVGKYVFVSSIGTADIDWYVSVSKISASKYEKKECSAKIAIVSSDYPLIYNVTMNFQPAFKSEIVISDYKMIRKLLELTDDSNYLCSIDGRTVSGVVHKKYLDMDYTSIVDIKGHLWWEFIGAKNAANLYYKEGFITIRNSAPDKNDVVALVENALLIPGDVKEKSKQLDAIVSIIMCACELNHGAILVFLGDGVEKESKRLNGIILEPVLIDELGTLSSFTSIDGAVLIDFYGKCHAISVILDGLAKVGAERSRGARYNSAERYCHEKTHNPMYRGKFLIVVISDDGMIDFFPKITL